MIDLTGVEHHPALEEVVEVLCKQAQKTDKGFFRPVVGYFLAKMASSMRATIATKDRGEIPVNLYTLALASSGYGKGRALNKIENELLAPFKKRFMQDTFQVVAEKNMWVVANDRAARLGSDQQEEFEKVEREFRSAGSFPFTFDSGTSPAVKQLRHKLLLASCGSINLQIDEIGSNLINNTEVLNLFLELYDQGIVKQKLVKNTADNQRGEEIDGKTPTNMLLFGTPAKLLDGGTTEDQFYEFLTTGYARRCLFGWGSQDSKAYLTQTPEESYANSINPTNFVNIDKWAKNFHRLADPAMFGWRMEVPDDVGIALRTYQFACEREADKYPEHEEIRKAELTHRYDRALKLAGAYAFADESNEVEMGHLMSAILLVEESGKNFEHILNREKSYVKLAKYIADVGKEVNHADLLEALPFYKSSSTARNEMMTLATAWGYNKHIIIKKTFRDGIELFRGETLKETNLNEMLISYSDHWAYNYLGESVPFEQLHMLTQAEGMHWANHHFKNGHRSEENIIPGFNMVVIDVDESVTLSTAHELLKEYKFMTYTTKRHTEEQNRFRLILPINYHLELDSADYKEFMNELFAWLPFTSDDSANQRAKKWETFNGGSYHYNLEGEILDALPFIPKTSKNETYLKEIKGLNNLDNLERWFAQRIASGNRNNQMIKFALALVDSGMDLVSVNRQVHEFNQKLSNALPEAEIDKTIMATVAKRFQKATT